ncbi:MULTISPECIES: glycoside hydrolase family 76 protein [Microbacterium]|uniref:glycoside hydrolase family 76 protein n=1 Tax=Microbacterium TaxID=33882 RepID=UPI00277DFD57|nr:MULTISPECIES: glycoside hydrolase family 76 protein [Microbacterium]MDQ1083319.1 putative alpha-1,6-mannanase (GH76 family) [Microbacterium sp. SORGH_AS_0344]MDQ1171401.1 putative alpha-1,6-mannanase (GH76 family) [Microbacterium proteolyticum]
MDAVSRAQERAMAAESAVVRRYVRRHGPVAWAHAATPGVPGARTWHYWWHAHLLHVLRDAQQHRPDPRRARLLRELHRGITLRTLGRWTTPFYDDVAWMTLALQRYDLHDRRIDRLTRRLDEAVDPAVGALPWAVDSALYNAPANGPAAIALAWTARRGSAVDLDAWVAATLDDPATGLVRDGVEHGMVRPELWTYNQGVAIGSALALAEGAPDADARDAHEARAASLVQAIVRWCEPDGGLFPAAGGGDGGLFAGILARYLAEAAVWFATDAAREEHRNVSRAAGDLVRRNAEALWHGRRDGLLPADPRRPARAEGEDLDLSVQLGGWITLEAEVAVLTS